MDRGKTGALVHPAGHQVCRSKHTLQMVEVRQDKVAGHDAELPGHRMRRKEEPHAVFRQGPTATCVPTDAGLQRTAEQSKPVGRLGRQAHGAAACLLSL